MPLDYLHLAALGSGFLLGSLVVSLLLRNQLTQVRRRAEAEMQEQDARLTRLNAEQASASEQLAVQRERLTHAEMRNDELTRVTRELSALRQQNLTLEKTGSELTAALKGQSDRHQELTRRLEQGTLKKNTLQQDLVQAREQIAELTTRLEEQAEENAGKIALLDEAKQRLSLEFQNLANQIFDEKSRKFSESSKSDLGDLLKPFREQIERFERKVHDTYESEGRERHTLMHEVKRLQQLNQQISQDAENLTKALKGDSKTQGTWGEIILERILEESGLRKGVEYDTQGGFRDSEGHLLKPDVVIHLPEGKDVVVDSKVSLSAYERFVSAEDDPSREQALREHLQSIHSHLRGLESKKYDELPDLRSLDFVLMFIPVEGAFMLAIEKDGEIFRKAFNQNIMIVSPSTLLVTLRTIQNIWRYEYQNRYALEIAQKAGDLYDKFVGFVGDLDKIGEQIDRTQKAYEGAHNKLISGKGNLVNRVQVLQELGVKSRKKLDNRLVEQAEAGIPLTTTTAGTD